MIEYLSIPEQKWEGVSSLKDIRQWKISSDQWVGLAPLSVAQPQLSYLLASYHWFFRWWHRYIVFFSQCSHRQDLTGLFCTDSSIVNKVDQSDPPYESWLVFQSGKNYGYLGQNASGEKNLKSLREFVCLFRIASPFIVKWQTKANRHRKARGVTTNPAFQCFPSTNQAVANISLCP